MKLAKKYLFVAGLIFLINTSFAQLNKAYFFYQGQKLISQSRFKESISFLNTLIDTDSSVFEGWFLRGVAKYYLQDYHGAINDFSKSIKINPVLVQAYHYAENRRITAQDSEPPGNGPLLL